ncbi:MAG: DUF1553 domain-containing protein, partial [Planctomycetes bacterium]|nr:DUF1553 domain-containing protein [Planctomycetota bacterium]
ALKPVQEAIAKSNATLKELEAKLGGMSLAKSVDAANLPGIVLDDTQATFSGDWKTSAGVPRFVGDGYRYASPGGATARYEPTIETAGRYEIRISHSPHENRASNALVTVRHADGETEKRIDQQKKPPLDGLFVSLGTFRFEAGGEATVVLTCQGANRTVIADAVQLLPVPPGGTNAEKTSADEADPERLALQRQMADKQARLAELQKDLKRLQGQAPPPPPLAMSVVDEQQTGDYHILIRGSAHKLGEKVPRGFLTVLPHTKAPSIADKSSGRRELAEWIASPKNPLPPRVIVNRVWQHLFGAGLVRTSDNFGAMGERPSHPELLDWLAAEFLNDGWSVKRTVRQIVLSATYQQASAARMEDRGSRIAEGANIEHRTLNIEHRTPTPQPSTLNPQPDPENRLLSRQNRRRLDAEALRDAILAVGGELDLAMGGRNIAPGTKEEFNYPFPGMRRSVYVPVFRNTLHPLFEVFDFADPNIVAGRRNTSTLPTQGLYLLNSPFVIEQSRKLATRLLADELDDGERLDRAYRRTLGRLPTDAERRLSLEFLSQAGATADSATADSADAASRLDAWAALCQSLVGSLDFRYLE